MQRRWVLASALAIVIGVGVVAGTFWMEGPNPAHMVSLVGGPFALVDQDGRATTSDDFKGEPFLVFFGYTHCPDVCPTTLSDMTQMLEALGKGTKFRAVFITVDPERDTPAVLKTYLSSFDPRITGLTGSPEAIAAAEKAYRVYAKKVQTANGDYSMDHTAVVYIMDRDGHFAQALDLQQAPDKAAADVRAVM